MKEDQSTVNVALGQAQEYVNWKQNLFEISRITKGLDWKAIENLIFNELLDDRTKKTHSKSDMDSINDAIENQDDNWGSRQILSPSEIDNNLYFRNKHSNLDDA